MTLDSDSEHSLGVEANEDTRPNVGIEVTELKNPSMIEVLECVWKIVKALAWHSQPTSSTHPPHLFFNPLYSFMNRGLKKNRSLTELVVSIRYVVHPGCISCTQRFFLHVIGTFLGKLDLPRAKITEVKVDRNYSSLYNTFR